MTEPPILTKERQPVETESESGTYDSLSEQAFIENKGSERRNEENRAKDRKGFDTEFGVPDKASFQIDSSFLIGYQIMSFDWSVYKHRFETLKADRV